jgi:ribosomal protein S18 acetylase RimI-like enzyme
MTIREAQLEDIAAINQINTLDLQHEYSLEKAKEQFTYLLNSPVNQVFVKEIAGQVVGYIQLSEYVCLYGPRLMNVLGLAVNKTFQGQGIGKELLTKGEQWALESGAEGIRLNSGVERTEAHKFYEHLGYKKVKSQINFRKLFTE